MAEGSVTAGGVLENTSPHDMRATYELLPIGAGVLGVCGLLLVADSPDKSDARALGGMVTGEL